ncbi:MAG TPA: hypothetical protein VJX67_21005 [Blastocatellia bacterium]|nr:hypothetical protein [Blastocatellia bacterium]
MRAIRDVASRRERGGLGSAFHEGRERRCSACNRVRAAAEFRVPPGRWHNQCVECRARTPSARVLRQQLRVIAWRLVEKGRGGTNMPEELAIKMRRLPDRLAAIVGKTFAIQGDDASLPDDEALTRIAELLSDIDPHLVARNKGKRLGAW